jgi:hypothetical protein
MKADAQRDQRALQLYLAGASDSQIASALGIGEKDVKEIVVIQLENSAARRSAFMDFARTINQERTEALFRAHYGPALRGDHRSTEICNRILEKQRDSLQFSGAVVEGDAVDEIAARRSARRAGTATGSARTKRPS